LSPSRKPLRWRSTLTSRSHHPPEQRHGCTNRHFLHAWGAEPSGPRQRCGSQTSRARSSNPRMCQAQTASSWAMHGPMGSTSVPLLSSAAIAIGCRCRAWLRALEMMRSARVWRSRAAPASRRVRVRVRAGTASGDVERREWLGEANVWPLPLEWRWCGPRGSEHVAFDAAVAASRSQTLFSGSPTTISASDPMARQRGECAGA